MHIPRSIGIHDGTFHADEVTACALLVIFGLVDEDKIFRTRDADRLNQCEYVCDVGGEYSIDNKRFDHHQASYNGSWSSAGMILDYLKQKKYISVDQYDYLNAVLIHGIDEQDNGRFFSQEGFCSFSDIIKYYNLPGDRDDITSFTIALHFTIDLVKKMLAKYEYEHACRKLVKQAMENSVDCLYFDEPLSWLDNFFALDGKNHPAKYVCFPTHGQWILRGIPPSLDLRMQVRKPFPNNWGGLLGDEFIKETGISGAIFCHKGLFLSVWQTKEDCQKALQYLLEMN